MKGREIGADGSSRPPRSRDWQSFSVCRTCMPRQFVPAIFSGQSLQVTRSGSTTAARSRGRNCTRCTRARSVKGDFFRSLTAQRRVYSDLLIRAEEGRLHA